MLAEKVLQSQTIFELLEAICSFCAEIYTCDNMDEKCMTLKEKVSEAENDNLTLLAAYLSACENSDEVVDSLNEFLSICGDFCEAEEEVTQQITTAETAAILDECEKKCKLKSCIEKKHSINLTQVNVCVKTNIIPILRNKDNFSVMLPKVPIDMEKEKYIAEVCGAVLYDVLEEKFSKEYLKEAMCIYIPEIWFSPLPIRELFAKYFYDVVLFRKQKPKIYTNLDKHLKRVIVLEFFTKIIEQYLRE